MSIKIVQRYRFLPRNAGKGEVDFMLVCRKNNELANYFGEYAIFIGKNLCEVVRPLRGRR